MAAPVFKKNKVSQKINLKDEFGIDFRGKDALKEALGQAIIDRIVDRSEAGKGMRFTKTGAGVPVKELKKPYSKEYANTLEFKAAGKSRGKVDMTLTGNMLGLLDITKIKGNTIEIGWDEKLENNKAHGHSVGKKGGATVPKRPFFGVSKKELDVIKKEFKDDIKQALDIRKNEGKAAFETFVLGLIEGTKKEGLDVG